MRALAGLGLALVEDEPAEEPLRSALAWHADARDSLANHKWDPHSAAWGQPKQQLLAGLLADAASDGHSGGAALTTAVAAHALASPAALRRRRASVTVLLVRSGEGVRARLTVSIASGLPPGLAPDPEQMSLFTADEAFQQALDRAWSQAGARHAGGTVLWSIEEAEGPSPCIDGESAGAALAVALDEIRRLSHPLPGLRVVRRLQSGTAIVGRIDDHGYLQSVEGYDGKLAALGEHSKVIVPVADAEKAGAAAVKDMEIVPVARWKDAARKARNSNGKVILRQGLAVTLILAIAAGLYAWRQERADHAHAIQAERATRQRAAQRLLLQASNMRGADPVTALRLDLAAQAIAPDPDTAAALTSEVTAAGFSRALPGHDLASAGLDGSYGWYTDISAMAASADGRLLVTADQSRTVFIWDVSDPLHPRRLAYLGGKPGEYCTCPGSMIALSGDGRTLATASPPFPLSITLWDLTYPAHPRREGSVTVPFPKGGMPADEVSALALSEHGDLFAIEGGQGTFLWNVADPGQPRPVSRTADSAGAPWPQAAGLARVSPGRLVAIAQASPASVTLWDTAGTAAPRRLAYFAQAQAARLSPDGRLLAVIGRDWLARVYDLSIPSAPRLLGVAGRGGHGVGDLAFSPDSKRLAVGSADGPVSLWDVRGPGGPRQMWTAAGHPAGVTAVTFLAGRSTFVTGAADGTLLLWDVAGQSMASHPAIEMNAAAGRAPVAVFAPREPLLAVGGTDGEVRLWDMSDPKRPRRLGSAGRAGAPVTSLAFSPDGTALAAGAANGTVRLWAVRSGADATILSGPPVMLRPYATAVTSVAFSSDGRLLAAAAAHDPSVRNPEFPEGGLVTLWPTGSPGRLVPHPRLAATIHNQMDGVDSVAFQPGRPRLVVGGHLASGYFYDVSTPSAPQQLPGDFDNAGTGSAAVAFSPDGRVLAYGAGETVTLDDPMIQADSLVITALRTGTAVVTSVGVAYQLLAVGLDNGDTVFYGLAAPGSPAPLFGLPGHGSAVRTVSFGPRGLVAITDTAGHLDLWDVTRAAAAVADPVATGCLMAGRGLTPGEWATYVTGVPFQPTCGHWAFP
jgi:WD40 repeat protein